MNEPTRALVAAPNHMTNLSIAELMQLGKTLLPSGFLPQTIKTEAQAVAVMLKGQELRIPPMYALSNIVVIKGKPTANAELMLALIYRDHGDEAIQFADSDAGSATITYKRRGWTARKTFAFTMDEAKRAGLLTNETWQKYPAAMLRARCISAVARAVFPDSIGGMYTPEELGAPVDEEGNIIDVQPRATATVERPASTLRERIAEPLTTAQRLGYVDGRALADAVDADGDDIDPGDMGEGADWAPNEPDGEAPKLSLAESNALIKLAKDKGVTYPDLLAMTDHLFGTRQLASLTISQGSQISKHLTEQPDVALIGGR